MLGKIVLGIAVVGAGVALVIARQPSEFRVTRSAVIPAAPPAVFAQINDLHHWDAWSPWEAMDPAMKKTFDGPSAGPGASFAWTGNSAVGAGRVTITDARAPELVRLRLDMLKPMAASNVVEFALVPDGGGTRVTWSMVGRHGFVGKAFGLVMNMDRMLGAQFEKGLAGLKTAATRS